MNICSNIKKLRRERDITQEQLAEYLNISVSAISQWECGKTTPDISQLAPLANIFDVSADVLLGIDVMNKEKQIQDIIVNAERIHFTAYEKSISILREGLKEYPNSYEIMERLMYCIQTSPHEKTKDETLISTKEIIELGEKILAECTNDKCRLRAVHSLCYAYSSPAIGMTEKAIELAEKLPNKTINNEILLAQLYEGEKKFKQLQKNMLSSFEMLTRSANELSELNSTFTTDEIIIINQKIMTLIEVMIEDGNYGFFALIMYGCCCNLALYYAKKMDYDKVMEYLQRSTEIAIKTDAEFEGFSEYTSLLLKGTPCSMCFYGDESFSMKMLEHMKHTAFDSIRQTADFIEIEAILKNK
jgi:transcriptional regulator with XRE-family HTH domain